MLLIKTILPYVAKINKWKTKRSGLLNKIKVYLLIPYSGLLVSRRIVKTKDVKFRRKVTLTDMNWFLMVASLSSFTAFILFPSHFIDLISYCKMITVFIELDHIAYYEPCLDSSYLHSL